MINNQETQQAFYEALSQHPMWTGVNGLFGSLNEDHFGAEVFAEYLYELKQQNRGVLPYTRQSINPESFLAYLEINRDKDELKYDQLIAKTKYMIRKNTMTRENIIFFAKLFSDLGLVKTLPQVSRHYRQDLQEAYINRPNLFASNSAEPAIPENLSTIQTQETGANAENEGSDLSFFRDNSYNNSPTEPAVNNVPLSSEQKPNLESAKIPAQQEEVQKMQPSGQNFQSQTQTPVSNYRPSYTRLVSGNSRAIPFEFSKDTRLKEPAPIVSQGENLRKRPAANEKNLNRVTENDLSKNKNSEKFATQADATPRFTPSAKPQQTQDRKKSRSAGARIARKAAAIGIVSSLAIFFGGGTSSAAVIKFLF